MGTSPLAAQDEPPGPVGEPEGLELVDEVPVEPIVETAVGAGAPRGDFETPELAPSDESKRTGWIPGVASGSPEADRPTQVGDSPVAVALRADDAEAARTVEVNVLEAGYGRQLSPFGAAVSVGFSDNAGRTVTPDLPFLIELDLSEVGLGDSGDVQDRLTVTRYEGCELFRPDTSELEGTEIDIETVLPVVACDVADELDADFDTESRLLSARVDIEALVEERAERRAALLDSGVPAADLDPKRGLERAPENALGVLDPDGGDSRTGADIEALAEELLESANPGGPKNMVVLPRTRQSIGIFLAQTGGGGGSVYGVTSGAQSSSGDFSALPAPTLTDAQVGLFSGSAEISYPIPVPAAAAGPEPSVALVYSSASVDGMSMGTNNQAGPLGIGWSLAAGGSIQRGLKACSLPQAPGDRCMSGSPDDVYTMNLGGKSSTLIRIDTGGYPKEFRLQSDPFWRIQLHSGGSVNGSAVSTPDQFNEWWSVETPDGTLYTLGTQAESVDWLPVYDTVNCSGVTYALCDRARQWNVDVVTDAFGNQMTYDYAQEFNWYNARQITTTYARKYVRASRIETITYGANPGLSKDPNARIVLNHEWRCGSTNAFSDCGAFPAGFHDTPTDLWCGLHAEADEYPTVCGEKAPTFWTFMRFAGALSQVADGAGGWITTAHHDPSTSWERDTGASTLDSANQMVLDRVRERPIDANGATAGGSFEKNGFDVLFGPDHDAFSGTGINNAVHDMGTESTVTTFGDEDWIRFDNVWMGDSSTPATEVTLRASSLRTGTVEVRIGSPTGTVIGSIPITATTGGSKDFETYTVALSTPTSGVRNIYLRGERGAGLTNTIGFINWVRFGHNPALALPDVAEARFTDANGYDFRDNRVNHPSGVSAMRFPRIKTFTNQLGGTVEYTYGQDDPCPGGKTSGWDVNNEECFPQWDTSTGSPGWVVFNKWAVQTMTRGDTFSSQPDVVTSYAYVDAGWGFADNPDSSDDTWNEFRGYNIVTVTDDAGKTEHRFHQGLDDEPIVGAGTRTKTVTRSDSTTIDDHYALRGMSYEVRRLTTGGAETTRDWSVYTNTTTVAGHTDRLDPRFVAVSQSDSRVDGTDSTRTLMTYNSWGQPLSVNEQGDTTSATDNRTTVTRYYNPTTSATLGAWRGTFPCVTAVRTGDSTAVPSQTSASGFVRYTQGFFDSNTAQNCNLSVTKPNQRRTAIATSDTGRVTTIIQPDNRGRVSVATNPRGYSTTTTYDNLHGQVTSTEIDAKSWTSSTGYDAWRRPITSTDINGRVTTTYYDEYSRVTAIREPVDAAESADTLKVTYNQDARPAYVQTERRLDGSSYTKSATFVDGFGRTLLTRSYAPTAGENWATASSYDSVGRQKYASAQYKITNDNVTTFEYPAWTTMPSFTEQSYDEASRPRFSYTRKGVSGTISTLFQTQMQYDGFTTKFFDQKNYRTDTTVDGLGRTLSVLEVPKSLTTSYTYNAADDLLTVDGPDGEVTTLTYDRAGRKLTSEDPDSGDWSYSYNANSSLTSQTDPSGDVTTFTYDELDRPTHQYVDAVLRGYWGYDPSGNLGLNWEARQYQTGGQGIVYQRKYYDSYGRTTQDQTFIPEPNSANLYRLRSVYTLRDDGQPASINHPSGTWYEYGYKVNYTYNTRTGLADGLVEDGGETIVDSVTWNQAGQLYAHKYGTDASDPQSRWYYNANTLRLDSDTFGTIDWISRHRYNEYTYDNNGNIEKIRELRNAEQHQCFTYDSLDRLLTAYTDTSACDGHTTVGDGNYNDTYTYSAGGNLTSKTGTGSGTHNGTYTYGDTDHVHAVTATSDGSTFVYDDDGNMTTRNLAGQPSQTLVWDDGQRLESLTDSSGTTEFLYGIDDTRVRRETGGTYTYYHADGTEYEHDGTTGTFTYYHRINGKTVGYTRDGTTTWMFADQVSSTADTRDETGAHTVQRYTPWGELRTDGSLTTDHHYTGQINDGSTGLNFYNARYQDPVVGRFVSPDTIVPNPADGQDYNRYAYVKNNPIKYFDPSGHCSVISGDLWCGGSNYGRNGSGQAAKESDAVIGGYVPGNLNIERKANSMYEAAGVTPPCGGVSNPSCSLIGPPTPVNWSDVADWASNTGDVLAIVEVTAALGSASPLCNVGCAATAAGAALGGVLASGTEMIAGSVAGEPGHVFAGGMGIATAGGSRLARNAFERAVGELDFLETLVVETPFYVVDRVSSTVGWVVDNVTISVPGLP